MRECRLTQWGFALSGLGEALKNANRHIQIKVPMTRMKKRHTMLVSMGDVKVRLSAAAAPEPPQRANREKRYCMYGSSDKTQ